MSSTTAAALSAEQATNAVGKTCPVCGERARFRQRPPLIASGHINICGGCGAYFLFPAVHVEYQASDWSSMRADGWDSDVRLAKHHAGRIAAWFEELMRRRLRSVLEVGCGSGFMGKGFAHVGVDYVGLDVDGSSIAYARAQQVCAYELPIEELPSSQLGRRKFDLVLSSNALEHVSAPQRAFMAIRQATAGLAVAIVPNPEGLLPRLKANRIVLKLVQRALGNERNIAHTIDGYWHNIAYSKRTLHYLAAQTGLRILQLRTIGINDRTFGFVQRNDTHLYRFASMFAEAIDMESQLMMVASTEQ